MAFGGGGGLSWIVVSHDSAADLRHLLPTLVAELASLAAAGLSSELIVADGASRDGSADVARALAPHAAVLALPANRGYGAAVNAAARRARFPWLAFTNADLLIPAGGLRTLPEVLAAAPADVALLAPSLRDPDGTPQPSVGRQPTLARLLLGLRRPRAARAFLPAGRHRRGRVDWASGACLFARADTFAAAGGFDERFHLYYEDCDLALRLARTGHATLHEPSLAVVHRRPHHGRPRDAAIEAHVRRSRETYFRAHRPAWEAMCLAALARLEPLLRPSRPAVLLHPAADGSESPATRGAAQGSVRDAARSAAGAEARA